MAKRGLTGLLNTDGDSLEAQADRYLAASGALGDKILVFDSPEQALALARDLMVFAGQMIAFEESKESEKC